MAGKRASGGVLVQAGILAAASMIVRVIGLLYRAPLTAIIGDEGNGYYGTAYNIYTIVLMVSSYSIPSAISKLMAQMFALGQYRAAQKVFRCALLYGLIAGIIGSALLFFGAPFFVSSLAVPVLRVFAPIIFLFGILGSLRGYFQAQGSMVQTSISQILEQLANAAVSIGAAWFLMHVVAEGMSRTDGTRQAQLGAMGSALGTGAGVVTALLFMFICFWKQQPVAKEHLRSDTSQDTGHYTAYFKETILVITPFMLSGVILNLTTSLNQTIYLHILIDLKHMDEVLTDTNYGIFSNKAVVISNIPISIATAVSSAIIPRISASFAKKDLQRTRRRSAGAIRATALIAIPSAAGLAVLARPITMIMFPQMDSLPLASKLLSMLAVTVIFYSVSTVTNAVLQSIGKMNMPLVSAGIALAVQTGVLVAMLLGTSYDTEALVIVSIIYSMMIFAVNQFFLHRYLHLSLNVKQVYGKPLLCAAVMGAAARLVYEILYAASAPLENLRRGYYFRNLVPCIIAIVIAVVIYGFMLVKTKTMTRENILSLPKGDRIVRILQKLRWM